MKTGLRTLLLSAVAAAGLAAPAAAGTILALVDGTAVAHLDPTSLKAGKVVAVKTKDRLLGIDVRPADGMLYGVTAAGLVVRIDPATGDVSPKAVLTETLKEGVTATVDFNPAADRLRVMGSDGSSHRVDVDSGKVVVDGSHKWKDGDPSASGSPSVVAGAYTNSVKGSKAPSTALYVVDATAGALALQAPPNDGVLSTIGPLGVKGTGPVAFEVVAKDGGNTGWLLADGALHQVDLATGKATPAGKATGLKGTVTDIAWWE